MFTIVAPERLELSCRYRRLILSQMCIPISPQGQIVPVQQTLSRRHGLPGLLGNGPPPIRRKRLLNLNDGIPELLASLVEVVVILATELHAVALAIPDCLVTVDTVAGHQCTFGTVRLEKLTVAVRLDSVLEDVFEGTLLQTAALGFRLDIGEIGLHIGFSFLMMVCLFR